MTDLQLANGYLASGLIALFFGIAGSFQHNPKPSGILFSIAGASLIVAVCCAIASLVMNL